MSTRFFTNNGENTLLAKFRGIFERNPDIGRFDALIGYKFRQPGGVLCYIVSGVYCHSKYAVKF